jgi:hypothetical protein
VQLQFSKKFSTHSTREDCKVLEAERREFFWEFAKKNIYQLLIDGLMA